MVEIRERGNGAMTGEGAVASRTSSQVREDRSPRNAGRKTNVALLSVISNTLLILLKIGVGILIGSVAVLSEAIHSGVDLVAALIALFAVRKSSVAADEQASRTGTASSRTFRGPSRPSSSSSRPSGSSIRGRAQADRSEEIEMPGWGVAVMLVSAIVNTVVSRRLFKVGRETDSVALQADGWHLRTDVYTSLGVMFGLLVIWVGGLVWPSANLGWIDPVVAILVALMIMKAAYDLTQGVGARSAGREPAQQGCGLDTRLRQAGLAGRCAAFTACARAKPAPTGSSTSTWPWTTACRWPRPTNWAMRSWWPSRSVFLIPRCISTSSRAPISARNHVRAGALVDPRRHARGPQDVMMSDARRDRGTPGPRPDRGRRLLRGRTPWTSAPARICSRPTASPCPVGRARIRPTGGGCRPRSGLPRGHEGFRQVAPAQDRRRAGAAGRRRRDRGAGGLPNPGSAGGGSRSSPGGVLVEHMVRGKREFVVGLTRDRLFGAGGHVRSGRYLHGGAA